MSYLMIFIAAIFVNNIVLSQFLGICPFLGVSKKISTALGMGFAVMFVMTLSAIVTFLIYYKLLVPNNLTFMITVEIILKKVSPPLYQALGIFLPLITTNCAVLGVAILAIQKNFGLLSSVCYGLANAMGFTLGIVLFAGLRERMSRTRFPAAVKGAPIALLTAGLLSMAFMGFAGIGH